MKRNMVKKCVMFLLLLTGIFCSSCDLDDTPTNICGHCQNSEQRETPYHCSNCGQLVEKSSSSGQPVQDSHQTNKNDLRRTRRAEKKLIKDTFRKQRNTTSKVRKRK